MLASTTKPHVEFDYLKSFIGRHLTDLFEELFPTASPEQVEAWIQQYRTIYPQRGHRQTTLYPDVEQVLARLPGIKTTATTKSTLTATNILTQFGLAQHFVHIQGTDGFPSKPKPDVLFRALAAIQVPAEECLFIGDSVPDMIAGKAAGVQVCAASYGYADPAALRACQPDYWIDNPAQLIGG